jgi:hypothetical protein
MKEMDLKGAVAYLVEYAKEAPFWDDMGRAITVVLSEMKATRRGLEKPLGEIEK